jgi:hypothetical protein
MIPDVRKSTENVHSTIYFIAEILGLDCCRGGASSLPTHVPIQMQRVRNALEKKVNANEIQASKARIN